MFIGIDTSNYTTSAAAYDGRDVINSRRILPVRAGQRGLRQSDALFGHIKQFGLIFDELMEQVDRIDAVGVSTRPRSCDGSYMPVFLAGKAFADTLAAGLKVPCYEFSHQDGHIMAALYSLGITEPADERFLSVHMSGGTTEIIVTRYNGCGFDTEVIGGTKDISAGQFIDRAGVKAGMGFPCGKELEKLSAGANRAVKLPVSEKDGYVNFSGVETMVQRMDNIDADTALGIFDNIARSMTRAINHCIDKAACEKIVIAGGVASNGYISEYFKTHINGQVLISEPQYATDNAAGIAVLAERAYCNE
jgi:N6-L-threonylcarbamoyladenine synthase